METLLTCAHCTSSIPDASTNEPRYSPTFAQQHHSLQIIFGLHKMLLYLLPVLAGSFRHLL
jgi:hypothetical protein